jgi:hypothetical protein
MIQLKARMVLSGSLLAIITYLSTGFNAARAGASALVHFTQVDAFFIVHQAAITSRLLIDDTSENEIK